MRAGDLNQRVTIKRQTTERDELGEVINVWTDLGTVWAAVEPLNGRELIAAQAAVSEVTVRVRMRYRADVKPYDQVQHGAKMYQVTSAIDPRSQGAELVLMCKHLA